MYAKIDNGKVTKFPYTFGDLRKDHPNVSFPRNVSEAAMRDFGMVAVTKGEKPTGFGDCQKARLDSVPTLVDGAWVIGYTVVDMFKTAAEEAEYRAKLADTAAAEARMKRNGLLAETDFHALSDVTMSPEMAEYRKALRDITGHASWPNLKDTDWPTKP